MRVAVIGAGVAGLVASHRLSKDHAVTLFEAEDYLGGHTCTVDVTAEGKTCPADTGFMVFNRRTYPRFCELLESLGVTSRPSEMSFSFMGPGFEYRGSSINSLLAQRSSILRPSFWRMLLDVVRFNRSAEREANDEAETLGQFLRRGNYSQAFATQYLLPMGAAIWSAKPEAMIHFPARYFIGFFKNHGLLSVNNHPQWYTVEGGARTYVAALIADAERLETRLSTPVRDVRRNEAGVVLTLDEGSVEFDAVVFACHSDQALALLQDPSDSESRILGAIPYQTNEAVLHWDETLLPKRRRAWAAWNYLHEPQLTDRVVITYNLNILQGLAFRQQCLVTLNPGSRIDPRKIIRRFHYSHPGYTVESIAAQAQRKTISGQRRTHYCGAYWRYGFHEDGVVSGLDAAAEFGRYQ